MVKDEELRRFLRTAHILQVASLGSVLVIIIGLIIMPYVDFTPPFEDDPFLTILKAILAVLGVVNITLGYILPSRIIRRARQRSELPQRLLKINNLQGKFFAPSPSTGCCWASWEQGGRSPYPFS